MNDGDWNKRFGNWNRNGFRSYLSDIDKFDKNKDSFFKKQYFFLKFLNISKIG